MRTSIRRASRLRAVGMMIVTLGVATLGRAGADEAADAEEHARAVVRLQRQCQNAGIARNWTAAIEYCQRTAKGWAAVADHDGANPNSSPQQHAVNLRMEGYYLVITAQMSLEAGKKREARALLNSARSVASRIPPGIDKTWLLQDIALRAHVADRP